MTAGIDTLSLIWPAQGGSRALSAIQGVPSIPYARGLLVAERPRSGMRIMAWPDYGVIKAEGRLGAILDGTKESWRLAGRAEVTGAEEAMRAQLREVLGAEPEAARPEVARVDLAADREFPPDEGLAVLAAAAALVPPRHLNRAYTAPGGRVQSVAMVRERSGVIASRIYDKGVESGSHPAGERIRFEGQNRYRSGSRPPIEFLSAAHLGALMAGRLGRFTESKELTVTHPSGVVHELAQRVAQDKLTMARAERLVGAAEFLRAYGRAIYGNEQQAQRRLRALRDVGVATTEHLPANRTVPMGELLAGVVEEFSRET